MDKFYNETLTTLETAINEMEFEADYTVQRIEVVVNLFVECLSKIKEQILQIGFNNTDEKIRVFKYQKPALRNSFTTMSFTKSRQRNPMEQSP